ncbi:MAG TPA: alpha/beta fold hydrolase [Actinomycetes bacterium]|jgi:pimeloyl-ACP methyl ester carboxylesterase|nr:alpha/beta fold hydrolase [Actinomycetes bacterium]
MPRAHANGVEIEYQTVGDPHGRPLLLVQGLGAQLISIEDGFCEELAARGFLVIRYDNRDAGRSTWFDDAPPVNLAAVWAGDHSSLAYTLEDMADDAAGVLDDARVRRAHVAGISLGGMIAQLLTTRHPSRVLSLASIMSTTGDRAVGQPTGEAASVLVTPMPRDRDGFVDQAVANARAISAGTAFPFDAEAVRRGAARGYDRAYHPKGVGRQFAAILAAGDRTQALGAVKVPTVVVHGEVDQVIGVSGGVATAAAIPGARLVRVPGLGHELPPGFWPALADALVQNADRADSG